MGVTAKVTHAITRVSVVGTAVITRGSLTTSLQASGVEIILVGIPQKIECGGPVSHWHGWFTLTGATHQIPNLARLLSVTAAINHFYTSAPKASSIILKSLGNSFGLQSPGKDKYASRFGPNGNGVGM